MFCAVLKWIYRYSMTLTLTTIYNMFEGDVPKVCLDFLVQRELQVHKKETLIQICRSEQKRGAEKHVTFPGLEKKNQNLE